MHKIIFSMTRVNKVIYQATSLSLWSGLSHFNKIMKSMLNKTLISIKVNHILVNLDSLYDCKTLFVGHANTAPKINWLVNRLKGGVSYVSSRENLEFLENMKIVRNCQLK